MKATLEKQFGVGVGGGRGGFSIDLSTIKNL